jgi:hypothetical protein
MKTLADSERIAAARHRLRSATPWHRLVQRVGVDIAQDLRGVSWVRLARLLAAPLPVRDWHLADILGPAYARLSPAMVERLARALNGESPPPPNLRRRPL